jgi:hypothetical protein
VTVLDRRHSDAALLVLAVATLALILTVTLALHHLVIGDDDRPGTGVGVVLIDHSSGADREPASPAR